MIWFAVDDSFESHEKVLELHAERADEALALWVLAGSWVGRQLTDGFVPQSYVTRANRQCGADELVRVGLWDEVDGGYVFHNFAKRNPSREQVLGKRAKDADRKRKAREAKAHKRARVHADVPMESTAESTAESRAPSARSPLYPDPTRPVNNLRSLAPPPTSPVQTAIAAASGVGTSAAVNGPPRRPPTGLDALAGPAAPTARAAVCELLRQLQRELPLLASFDDHAWADDWAWLAAQPLSERAQVIATLKKSSWAQSKWRRCNPAHLRKYWQDYAAGEEPGPHNKPPSGGGAAALSGIRKRSVRVSSREDILRALAEQKDSANDNHVEDPR